jgi:hypothetical protein
VTTTALRYTSSREQDNRLRLARVAAAGRVQAARVAREARVNEAAAEFIAGLRGAGAVEVGFKVCDESGKYRFRTTLDEAERYVRRHFGADMEAWGIDASGEFVGEGW